MNVTLLNDRSEDYIQKRSIFFDPKWMPQLRFILGSEFDKLSLGNKKRKRSLGRIPAEDDMIVKIKNMGNVLKERLKNLSNYIIEKEENHIEKSFLNLIYNTALLDINTKYEKPLAILGAPVNRPQSFDYSHLKQILTDYEGMTIFESDKIIGIPFDLIFCDFTKLIKYGAVILNKKHNEKLFKNNNQKMSYKLDSLDVHLNNLNQLTKKAFFLTQNIRNRYFYLVQLIYYGMDEVNDNSQIPLTKTGKVYKITSEGRIWYDDHPNENISVKIYETETTIQLDSETPMAIVELIEEVNNEREKLEEMSDKEFKQRWHEAIIEEVNYEHKNKVNEELRRIKRRYGGGIGIEYENNENMRNELEETQNKQKQLLNEKIENIKIKNDKLFEKGLLNIKEEHEKMLEKYDDFIVELKERWFEVIFYHVLECINGDKKKVIIKLSKEKEKGEASSSNNIQIIKDKQEEQILYFEKNNLFTKLFLLKSYGKENAIKLFKRKKDTAIFVNINDEDMSGGKFSGIKMRKIT
ncbi:unnamed protein product [Meloidogyne enterolobii]|uniref:Uncharacterized protein n=1 Tax=Meloidogyne enterolobii TaxID=390850 RepID=A0ACB0YE58_MELEN